jgi:arginine/lysine/ornithine decarboxylase
MIHFRGGMELMEKLRCARFRVHTTSPNYPILASLDLARAQMQRSGKRLIERSSVLAESFCEKIRINEKLSSYSINSFILPRKPFAYACLDPTKVSINVSGLDISATDVKELLYSRYGIYVNRVADNSILLNFHIGITPGMVDMLINALENIQSEFTSTWAGNDVASNGYIIPYPPGVPLVVPGDRVTPLIRKKIHNIQRSGVHVFTV